MEERLSRKFNIVSGILGKKFLGFDNKEFEERIYAEFSKDIGCAATDVDSRLKAMPDDEFLPRLKKCITTVKQEFISTHELKRGKKKKAIP